MLAILLLRLTRSSGVFTQPGPFSGHWANAGRIVSRTKPDAPGMDSGQRTRSAPAKGLAKLGVSAPSASQCRGLAGAAPAPNSPGAVANPVHFFGTKNAAGVYPDRRDAIIWRDAWKTPG